MSTMGPQIAVIGGATCGDRHLELAYQTGIALGQAGAVLLCGGRSGVMKAAAEGALSAGGSTVGVLPGTDPEDSPPNPFIQTKIFTGMGQARNQVLILSAEAVIGIGGGWGTLTEIGLALKHHRPVVLLDSWNLELPDSCKSSPLYRSDSPTEAVHKAFELLSPRRKVR